MLKKQQRMTRQKMVILEELSKVTSHPTAYEVYEMVRERIPRISLGTVYRNLEQLGTNGKIRRLDLGQGQRRFDAVAQEHMHIQFISCGRVDDVPLNSPISTTTIKETVSITSGYEVLGLDMEFQGLCPECRKATCKQA